MKSQVKNISFTEEEKKSFQAIDKFFTETIGGKICNKMNDECDNCPFLTACQKSFDFNMPADSIFYFFNALAESGLIEPIE